MNSIVLCEGFDDVFILGYYLYKTDGWDYKKDGKISELYDFPKVNFRNQIIEVYKKGNDSLAIWCVGGKDSFEEPFKFLKKINEQHPEDGLGQVFVLSDRDNFEIEECLKIIEDKMKKSGLDVGNLKNNQSNFYVYEVENETYKLNVVPIIIPFEEAGALETVLMVAIQESGEEDKLVVEEAKKYVNSLIHSGELKKYLQRDRQILKAKFSSAISITNPDRSTALFNTLLMSYPWEEKEEIAKHFRVLNEMLR